MREKFICAPSLCVFVGVRALPVASPRLSRADILSVTARCQTLIGGFLEAAPLVQ